MTDTENQIIEVTAHREGDQVIYEFDSAGVPDARGFWPRLRSWALVIVAGAVSVAMFVVFLTVFLTVFLYVVLPLMLLLFLWIQWQRWRLSRR